MAFTFFPRDPDCLELAVRALLPQTVGRIWVRIWDAGCAMGHEPIALKGKQQEGFSGDLAGGMRCPAPLQPIVIANGAISRPSALRIARTNLP
jgi:hypothetical protein